MQTFLPYPDFTASARVLDNKRLGKQRLECKQLLKAIEHGGGWANHPATKMWRNYPDALRAYYNAILCEWVARGFYNTMQLESVPKKYKLPPWLGNTEFHRSHRSNLLRKDPRYYHMFSVGLSAVDNDLQYIWPEG